MSNAEEMPEVILSEANIQSIINGRKVVKTLADGTRVAIRQSYLLDVAVPVRKERFEVKDTTLSSVNQLYGIGVKPR
ncbi:hypothetical protein R6Z02_12675 [Carnobacterium maltaromaticum]|uniref:hypothetical protein n=1 Tax=Carnobacterium maltaromaticum TaxID=2751 RepID=UPI00298BB369|nr:hypothetical protein [Carnobacterium maltaromaticum]MDW5524605.1 hypothetical protein [Carnobacterium maltaromaticum]